MNPPYDLLWSIGVDTGLRISDLLRLRIGDIPALCDGYYITEIKTGKTRKVQLTRAVAASALAAARGRLENEYIWASSKRPGQPIARQTAWRAFRRAERISGIKNHVGTHSARKTFAQTLYRHTDLETVQEVLHHRYPSTTLFYVMNPRVRRPSASPSSSASSTSQTSNAPKVRKPRRESGGARRSLVTKPGRETGQQA